MTDDLFTPSLQGTPRHGKPPWNTPYFYLVGTLGGPLPIGIIGFLNGRRLNQSRGHLALIVAASSAGLIGWLIAAYTLDDTRLVRYLGMAGGLAVAAIVVTIQKGPARTFILGGGAPARLLGPAVAICAIGMVIQLLLVIPLTASLS